MVGIEHEKRESLFRTAPFPSFITNRKDLKATGRRKVLFFPGMAKFPQAYYYLLSLWHSSNEAL